jgi:hypothetical protein
MMNSLRVTPDLFPLPPDLDLQENEIGYITCTRCDTELSYTTMGAVVPQEDNPEVGELLCLICADEDPHTIYEESIWVLGLEELRGVLEGAEPTQDVQAARARVWRVDENNFQIALTDGGNLLFLLIPVERLVRALEAINRYQLEHDGETENYLEKGLAELERLANKNRG